MAGTQSREQVIKDLTELIEAIDRRLPRLGHLDEPAIAGEAAALRARAIDLRWHLEEAVKKIKAAETAGTDQPPESR